jgi:pyridoxal phosphate enzyme (YggS family)
MPMISAASEPRSQSGKNLQCLRMRRPLYRHLAADVIRSPEVVPDPFVAPQGKLVQKRTQGTRAGALALKGAANSRIPPPFRGRYYNACCSAGATSMSQLSQSPLAKVRAEIRRACLEARRDPSSVTLVAIAKTFGPAAIEPVIAQGQRAFGENRVQEAKAKWPALMARHSGIELHLVGTLQSNKAKEAVALFDAIHSLDRPSLAVAVAKEIAKQGRRPTLFVEVNTGGEPQKSGVLPHEADAFIRLCRERHGLAVAGLMCIPPADEAAAPHFALTAKVARRNGLPLLSMGMSADFPLAIQFGATHVRVGTAIFGARG